MMMEAQTAPGAVATGDGDTLFVAQSSEQYVAHSLLFFVAICRHTNPHTSCTPNASHERPLRHHIFKAAVVCRGLARWPESDSDEDSRDGDSNYRASSDDDFDSDEDGTADARECCKELDEGASDDASDDEVLAVRQQRKSLGGSQPIRAAPGAPTGCVQPHLLQPATPFAVFRGGAQIAECIPGCSA